MAGSRPTLETGMSAPSTAESALRNHVRAERIKLPKVCCERSLPWILAFCGRPFAWIAGALVLADSGTPDWIVWPVAALCLLLAQRHFQTLVHDASHGFYHRKGPINDLLANWLAAGWIGMTVENYRRIHFRHHAHNGSAEDPEHVSFATVTEAGGLLRMVVRYACLLEAFRLVRKYYGGEREPQRAPCGVKDDQRKQPAAHVHIVATQ